MQQLDSLFKEYLDLTHFERFNKAVKAIRVVEEYINDLAENEEEYINAIIPVVTVPICIDKILSSDEYEFIMEVTGTINVSYEDFYNLIEDIDDDVMCAIKKLVKLMPKDVFDNYIILTLCIISADHLIEEKEKNYIYSLLN